MTDDQPPKLDYQSPTSQRSRFSWGVYSGGLVAGLAFSFLYYLTLVFANSPNAGSLLLGAVIIKIVVGVVMLTSPRYRTFGRGVLLSIPAAILLGIGTVFIICSGMKI